MGRLVPEKRRLGFEESPSGPLGFNLSQHGPTTRPSVESTAETAFMLSDRVSMLLSGGAWRACLGHGPGDGTGKVKRQILFKKFT